MSEALRDYRKGSCRAFPEFLLEYFKREYWDSLEQKPEGVTNVDCQYESV